MCVQSRPAHVVLARLKSGTGPNENILVLRMQAWASYAIRLAPRCNYPGLLAATWAQGPTGPVSALLERLLLGPMMQ